MSRRRGFVAFSLLCGAAVYSQAAEASIYTYIDKDGTRWLTNAPKKGRKYKLVAKYGAPQKPRTHSVFSPSTPFMPTSYEPSAIADNGRGHCGGLTAAQLERRLEPHLGAVRSLAQEYGVEENLVRAVMQQESCFNPKARSRAGALGLMQLMPGTASLMGVDDALDPLQNIQGGVKYLRQQLSDFNGDKRLALAAYNAGPQAVRKYGKVPPYRETQNYVAKIMAEYDRLERRSGIKVASGFQRSAQIHGGYGWARPVEDFSVFRGRVPAR